jgi:DNA-binding MarR family transcriptional regulator
MKYEGVVESMTVIFSLKHVLFRDFDITSLGFGLNKTEERVLMKTWLHDGVPMRFLSRDVGLEKGSLTTVIDSLEAKGLVSRTRDETDRRSFIVSPTPAGARRAEQIDALFRNHLEALLGKLSPEDRDEFERAALTFSRVVPLLSR